MPGQFFRLDGKRQVVPCSAQEWFDQVVKGHDRSVARTAVGYYVVSTVFWGIAHDDVPPPPLVFETRVFPDCGLRDLSSTYEEALAVHARMVAELRSQ